MLFRALVFCAVVLAILAQQSPRPGSGRRKSGRGDRHIETGCTVYSNLAYHCQTNCTGPDSTKPVPDQPQKRYMDLNCSIDVSTKGLIWQADNGIIEKPFNLSKPSELLATCAFYASRRYECFGVADCGAGGESITICSGGAPWRGYYEGTPLEYGLKGNITHRAMPTQPLHPRPPHLEGPFGQGNRTRSSRPAWNAPDRLVRTEAK